MTDLRAFLTESLRIEGIDRPPTDEEMQAAEDFLALDGLFVPHVERLVAVGVVMPVRAFPLLQGAPSWARLPQSEAA